MGSTLNWCTRPLWTLAPSSLKEPLVRPSMPPGSCYDAFFVNEEQSRCLCRILPCSQLPGSRGVWESADYTVNPHGTTHEVFERTSTQIMRSDVTWRTLRLQRRLIPISRLERTGLPEFTLTNNSSVSSLLIFLILWTSCTLLGISRLSISFLKLMLWFVIAALGSNLLSLLLLLVISFNTINFLMNSKINPI